MSKVKKAQLAQPNAAYSPYIISGSTMYISGQLPIKGGVMEAVSGGIKMQTLCVLENMEALLKQEGLDRNNVIQCRAYLTDISLWDDFNEVYCAFFSDHRPARAVIPVSPLLFYCNIELEAIAELPGN